MEPTSTKPSKWDLNQIKAQAIKIKNYLWEDKFALAVVVILGLLLLGSLISFIASKFNSSSSSDNNSSAESFPSASIDTFQLNSPSPSSFATFSPSPTASVSASPTATPTPSSNGQPDQVHSSMSLNPSSLSADGSSKASITITLNDSNNHPISGLAISLSTADSRAVFTPSTTGSNVTDLSGHATFTISSTSAGTDNINVVATSSSGTSTTLSNLGTVTFTEVASPTPSVSPSPSPTP